MKSSIVSVVSVCAVMVSLSATAAPPSQSAVPDENCYTNTVVIAPSNSVEYAELVAKQASLVKQQQEWGGKVESVYASLSSARHGRVTQDPELLEMAKDIAAKQAAFDKRKAEKYPELGKAMKARAEVEKEGAEISAQLFEVRKRMAIIEGRIGPDMKP